LDTSRLSDSLRLRGYQSFGARFALVQRRVVLGDEMGAGQDGPGHRHDGTSGRPWRHPLPRRLPGQRTDQLGSRYCPAFDDSGHQPARQRPGGQRSDGATRAASAYLDLRPDTDTGPYLRHGDVIGEDRTAVPLAVETLLTNLDALVRSVDPDAPGVRHHRRAVPPGRRAVAETVALRRSQPVIPRLSERYEEDSVPVVQLRTSRPAEATPPRPRQHRKPRIPTATRTRAPAPAGRWRLLVAVLALLVAGCLVAAAGAGRHWYDTRQLDRAHQQALAATRQTALNFVSISAASVDRDLQRIAAGATGEFKDEFTRGMPQVRAAVVENNVESRGTVLRAGLISGDRDSAVVLVAIDATVKNVRAPDGRLAHDRIQVDLAKRAQAGGWLVSRLQFVG
jgi:Mce-associated membrane protein